jgi:hypothetical protein
MFIDGDAVLKCSSTDLGKNKGTPRRVAGDYWYTVRFVVS